MIILPRVRKPLFSPVSKPCEASDRQVSIIIGHEKHNYTLPHLPSVSLRAQVADPLPLSFCYTDLRSRKGNAFGFPKGLLACRRLSWIPPCNGWETEEGLFSNHPPSKSDLEKQNKCAIIPLLASICTRTARCAPSKNTAIPANLANRTLTKGVFTLNQPSGAIKKQCK